MCNCRARRGKRGTEWGRGRFVREAEGGRDGQTEKKCAEDFLHLMDSLGWLESWTGTGALQVRFNWELEAVAEKCVCERVCGIRMCQLGLDSTPVMFVVVVVVTECIRLSRRKPTADESWGDDSKSCAQSFPCLPSSMGLIFCADIIFVFRIGSESCCCVATKLDQRLI